MEVSEIILWKYLGEDVYNLLISRAVLKNDGPVIHQFPIIVHVYLSMLGPLFDNWIYGYINSPMFVTKEDSGESTTKIKLLKNALQPNFLDASIHRSSILRLCWR